MVAKREREEPSEDLHEALAERHACFVLITCSEPSADGKMQVEMTYEGDPSLAAYLIESAYGLIENQNEPLIGND
jgi:hypothetical protein